MSVQAVLQRALSRQQWESTGLDNQCSSKQMQQHGYRKKAVACCEWKASPLLLWSSFRSNGKGQCWYAGGTLSYKLWPPPYLPFRPTCS